MRTQKDFAFSYHNIQIKTMIATRNVLFSALLTIFCLSAVAQTDANNQLPHFLFPGFTMGVTKTKDGKAFSSKLNYNMVDEIMVIEVEGTYRYAKNLNEIDTIFIEYKKFVPAGKVFYEVLSDGDVALFLQNKSTLVPKGSNVGYGSRSQSVGQTDYRRFEMQPFNVSSRWDVVNIDLPPNVDVQPASVYWVRKNGEYEKFTNLNKFVKIFPGHEAKLKDFIKKENLSMKSREDLVKLVNYCSEIAR